ncbi:MAG TPA: YkgJ family cysteine cluster protein [Kofleriaceae bacterium]|nr:YkgJ family cysteine cluster protein [Kofleriaceae bacterium]
MLARFYELTAKIDAFFDRVHARHATDMRCAAGCDLCCRARLTVTRIEAAAIVAWARMRSAEERAVIAHAAAASSGEPSDDTGLPRCSALDDAGRCRIYDARPVVCRSHGVPVRMKDARSLPVVTSCELNFTARGPGAADADCILDQELISTMLGLLDRAYAAETESETERVELADLLAALADADHE